MGFRLRTARRRTAVATSCFLGGFAATAIAAPAAVAAPDQCSAGAVASTVSTVTGSMHQYLANHSGASQVLTAAQNEPRPQAESDVRGYFTAHPQEYFELRGILAPVGNVERQCQVTVLSPDLQSAYDEFMAG